MDVLSKLVDHDVIQSYNIQFDSSGLEWRVSINTVLTPIQTLYMGKDLTSVEQEVAKACASYYANKVTELNTEVEKLQAESKANQDNEDFCNSL